MNKINLSDWENKPNVYIHKIGNENWINIYPDPIETDPIKIKEEKINKIKRHIKELKKEILFKQDILEGYRKQLKIMENETL